MHILAASEPLSSTFARHCGFHFADSVFYLRIDWLKGAFMFRNIHVFQATPNQISEAIIDIAGRRNITAIAPSDTAVWKVLISTESSQWISVFDNQPDKLRESASDLSVLTSKTSLAISIDLPLEWNFWVFSSGDLACKYAWSIPPADDSQTGNALKNLTAGKLRDLGIDLPARMRKRMNGSDENRGAQIIHSSDPHVELHFRKKISDSKLAPPEPELAPELPKILSTLFAERTAARFRKILGIAHLSVENMAAEFTSYLEINQAFATFDDRLAALKKQSEEDLFRILYFA
jgi:hypothetical protein